MNYWNPQGDPNGNLRESNLWDLDFVSDKSLDPNDVTKVIVEGDLEVIFAGFSSPKCLSLAPNGLIVEESGPQCNQERDSLCEYQSCYTKEGFECVFPFTYKNVSHDKCISEDVYQPWYATGQLSS